MPRRPRGRPPNGFPFWMPGNGIPNELLNEFFARNAAPQKVPISRWKPISVREINLGDRVITLEQKSLVEDAEWQTLKDGTSNFITMPKDC